MKKKLAILLSAVMVAGVIPMTALAGTTTYVNKTVTVEKGDVTTFGSLLTIKDGNNDLATEGYAEFTLELEGAEWDNKTYANDAAIEAAVMTGTTNVDYFSIVSTKKATVGVDLSIDGGQYVYIPLLTKITDKGDVTVTVDGKNSVVSSGTFTYAVAISGSATAKVGGTVNIPETGAKIKDITISETAAGALEAGQIKLKLSKNFKFDSIGTLSRVLGDDTIINSYYQDSDRELIIELTGSTADALEMLLKDIVVVPDDAKIGSVAEITISGAGMTKTTLEVGTYVDYGVKIAIYDEDEEMPTFYAGKVYDEEDDATLAVIVSENVANSINTGRKMTFTFPEGVKVTTGYYKDGTYDYAEGKDGTGLYEKDDSDKDAWDKVNNYDYEIKNNVVTIKNMDISGGKAKMTFAFNLAISPEFAGDVDVVVGGAALDHEETLTVAKVVPGFTVEAEINEVAIDYRNVAASDIVIKETEPGLFEKDDEIVLAVENMQFEKGMDYEVTAGDIEVDDLHVNGGAIVVEIKDESVKAAGEITLSNVQLFLDRSLPAGDYDIIAEAGGSSMFDACNLERKADTVYFDIDDVTLVKGYIKVVTAGRDVDDSTFTTKIVVPVGSYTIKAGEKDIAIDVPAFINADGYTMMPLRAVVEALSGTAIVTWDHDTKTATVLFGARVISMTIGQKSMKINGVDVAMLAAPVIVESRTFLPLRDLGYALGLNESQVNWNAETKTATLN
ncbi:MAG: copper amine oxidase N-terminal domain-containing protein [Firmicutes bacterium]|nr:copper amine oxidase N-terminal domain-containing protein [Bacillota bacterium]